MGRSRIVLVILLLVAVPIVSIVGAKQTQGVAGSSVATKLQLLDTPPLRSMTLMTPDRKMVVLRDDGTWSYASSTGSVLERWKSLSLRPELIEQFRGAFQNLGVRIIDTNETLTCHHRGDRIEFDAGINEGAVDATVEIFGYQAERLAGQIERGALDEVEWFRVARALFASGAGKRVVQNPLSSNVVLRHLINAKNLVHVFLLSPDANQEPDATFTLINVNGTSMLVPGLYGTPERVFRLTVADALELQRKFVVEARHGGFTKWFKLARWYVGWRKKVEAPS